MTSLSITATSLVNANGCGKRATLEAIRNNKSGLREVGLRGLDFATWLGMVDAVEDVEIEASLQRFNCRNNKIAKLALDTDYFREKINVAVGEYGSSRIGVFIGTSTSGKAEAEYAYANLEKVSGKLPSSFDMLHTHNMGSVQDYVQHSLGLDGPGLTISTACSSSAKVFATAYRYMKMGLCDAAIVGGVDSLCLTTLYGFKSLQLVSSDICRPWDADRNGINIGEAAGFMLLEKRQDENNIKFKGFGESSDAYHMSTPHPEGKGAKKAINAALVRAGLAASDIDYVNLHGTATPSNDAAEAKSLESCFSREIICSSTKGYTGHTLGAAGITEAIISSLVLENNILPGNVNLNSVDPNLIVPVLKKSIEKSVKNVMSNSFGFGGSNCSLVFGW